MDLLKWSESEVAYGRRVLDSGVEGFRAGRDTFLHGNPLNASLNESVRKSLTPAALGALLGILGSAPASHHKSIARTLLFGLVGSAIGFGTGVVWQNRHLAGNAARGAVKNIHKVRDEHWVEKHPVAYA